LEKEALTILRAYKGRRVGLASTGGCRHKRKKRFEKGGKKGCLGEGHRRIASQKNTLAVRSFRLAGRDVKGSRSHGRKEFGRKRVLQRAK